jgi:uncharacterized phage infection (PIP) family protein YhgE
MSNTKRVKAGTIEKLTNKLDKEINKMYSEYIDMHESLNKHRGKPVDDSNIDEVNALLKDIQEQFNELYPAYNFIANRYVYAVNCTNSYNDFIESLRKAGLKEYARDEVTLEKQP